MAETASALRVALISNHDEQGQQLRRLLEAHGVQVVRDEQITEFELGTLGHAAEVLLVNLDEETSTEVDRLELLIEQAELPILFNEGGVPASEGWIERLVGKLRSLAAEAVPVAPPEPVLTEIGPAETVPPPAPALRIVRPEPPANVPTVWVLGASLGGPQAVKAFLQALPDDLPAAFIYAQHIGPSFVPLLAQQMQRVTGLRVAPARQGQAVTPGEMLVVPVEQRFMLTERNTVHLSDEPIPGSFKPCVDDVLEQVVKRFGNRAGAIIFSGMSDDGARGVRHLLSAGGTVFAQNADSCVISSMPDAARRAGAVTFSGTPEDLAERVTDYLRAAETA